jgi:hypothetical protein
MKVSFSHNNSLVKKTDKNTHDSQMDFGDCSAVGAVLSEEDIKSLSLHKDDPSLEEQINALQDDSDI